MEEMSQYGSQFSSIDMRKFIEVFELVKMGPFFFLKRRMDEFKYTYVEIQKYTSHRKQIQNTF